MALGISSKTPAESHLCIGESAGSARLPVLWATTGDAEVIGWILVAVAVVVAVLV